MRFFTPILFCLSFLVVSDLQAQCNDPATPTPGLGTFGCEEAPLLCSLSELDGYFNCTAETGVGFCPPQFCGTCENYQWFSFVATTTSLQIEIIPLYCDGTPTGNGMQAVIYETDDCFNFWQVSNCESPSSLQPLYLQAGNLEIGSIYYLMLDGWAGDICEYEIDVLQGGDPLLQGADLLGINGPAFDPCVSVNSYFYEAVTDPPVVYVEWTIPSLDGVIVSGQGTNVVQVEWYLPGPAEICASTSGACGNGEQICYPVWVELASPVIEEHQICLGDTVVCGGEIYTSPGTYLAGDTILSNGCIAELICVVELLPSVQVNLGTVLLCEDECFLGDSSFCSPGTYSFTTVGSNGCDSTVVFALETMDLDVAIQEPTVPLCGDPVLLEVETSVVTSDTSAWTGSIGWEGPGIVGDTSGGSILAGTPGTYIASFSATQLGQSCTVADTFELVIFGPTLDSLQLTICEGDTVTVGASSYSVPGLYTDTLTGSTGCDSVIVLDLSVDSILFTDLMATLCAGDSLLFGTNYLMDAGTYEASYTSQLGCDSVVILELAVAPVYADTFSVQLCAGESIQVGDSLLNTTGIYELMLTSIAGCDSLLWVELEVLPSFSTEQEIDLCAGDTLVVGNSIYTETGVYQDTFLAANGCDSVITTMLTVPNPILVSFDVELCANESIQVNGVVYAEPGIYQDTAFDSNGCDSVYYSLMIEAGWEEIGIEELICEGEQLVFNGVVYTQEGIYLDTLPGIPGFCGDVVEITLNVWETDTYVLKDTLCPSETLQWQGQEITEAGTYVSLIPNGPFGCFDTLQLEVVGSPEIEMLSYEIESSFLTQTGSIYPEWGGGTPPLTFEWSSGQNTPFIENVPFANYLVTVIDSRNCFQSWGFQLGGVIGDPGIQFSSHPLKLWPNPLDEEELHLELPEGYDGPGTLELLSVHGQSVMKTEVGFAGGRGATKVGDLPAGVYFLRLQVGQEVWTERVQV
jgi:hypothetical protein